jgi:hypothetical protein
VINRTVNVAVAQRRVAEVFAAARINGRHGSRKISR